MGAGEKGHFSFWQQEGPHPDAQEHSRNESYNSSLFCTIKIDFCSTKSTVFRKDSDIREIFFTRTFTVRCNDSSIKCR